MIRSIKAGGRTVEYTLICARNRTNLLLQALPEGKIRLYAPTGYSVREADKLIKNRLSDIDRAHQNMQSAAHSLPGTLLYEGRRLKINIQSARGNRISLNENEIRVLSTSSDEGEINAQIKRWLVKQALEKIRLALDKWSPTVNRPYYRVTIREQRTRWGSCSSKSNLNFNWKLIMAPPEALKYVVIHELCHLLYLNHSENFWAEVRRRMPDYEIWKKWLKAHGQELRFP